jgi:enamine deaminase RidA (YjgF/YER057c/UK114 family)
MAAQDLKYVMSADDSQARAAIKRVASDAAASSKGAFGSALSGIKGALKGPLGLVSGTIASAIGNTISTAITSQIRAAVDMGKALVAEAFSQTKAGIIDNASLEQAITSMTSFTKDAGIAKNMIAALRKEADVTPFDTGEMIEAGQSLVMYAKKSTAELLKLIRVAEILAALNNDPSKGGGMANAAYALKSANAGDFVSVMDRFNIGRDLINKFKAEGKQGIDVVTSALAAMGATMDLVTAQGKTFTGRLSTLKGFGTELRRTLTEGLFNWLSEKLAGIGGYIDRAGPGILAKAKELGDSMGRKLGEAIDQSMAAAFAALKSGTFGAYLNDMVTAVLPLVKAGFTVIAKVISEVLFAEMDIVFDAMAKGLTNPMGYLVERKQKQVQAMSEDASFKREIEKTKGMPGWSDAQKSAQIAKLQNEWLAVQQKRSAVPGTVDALKAAFNQTAANIGAVNAKYNPTGQGLIPQAPPAWVNDFIGLVQAANQPPQPATAPAGAPQAPAGRIPVTGGGTGKYVPGVGWQGGTMSEFEMARNQYLADQASGRKSDKKVVLTLQTPQRMVPALRHGWAR